MQKQLHFFLILFTLLGSFVSCMKAPKLHPSISKMEWLIGSWEGTANDKPFYEAWRKLNDSTLINFTIEITGTDTIVKENGMIRVSPTFAMYKSGSGQWDLTKLTDTEMVFANDTMKYSNEILWSLSADGHWMTVIKNPGNTINYDIVPAKWLDYKIEQYMRMVEQSKMK